METRRLNPEQTAAPPGYYVWEVPGKPIQVQIDLDVVDRMLLDVMRGFGAVPRRGAEVGGLLLGTSEYGDKLVVRIEDFEPVPCEYRNGPSFHLSETDTTHLEEALERWRAAPERRIYVVGYYRSHTRDGLFLAGEDMDLINQYFADPTQVYLLVKPFATRVSVAGLFFQEDGEIHGESTYKEFPFRRRELQASAIPGDKPERPGGMRVFEEALSRPAPEAAPAPAPVAALGGDPGGRPVPARPSRPAPDLAAPLPFGAPAAAPSEPRPRSHFFWVPLSLVFLALGLVLGFAAALLIHGEDKGSGADPYALNLAVVREGDNLNVTWDPQMPAIRRSLRGTLTITDGAKVTPRQLSPQELEVGRAVYHRLSNSVVLRLEVFTAENASIAEKMELHLGGDAAEPSVPAKEPAQHTAAPQPRRRRKP